MTTKALFRQLFYLQIINPTILNANGLYYIYIVIPVKAGFILNKKFDNKIHYR